MLQYILIRICGILRAVSTVALYFFIFSEFFKKIYFLCDLLKFSIVLVVGGQMRVNIKNRHTPDFDTVYNTYADLLYRVALAQLGTAADAEDAVQDVFIKYMTKAPVFFSDDHEKAWLIRVTVNRCHDIARTKTTHAAVSLDEITELAAEDDSEVRELMDTLSRLPEKYRETVTLHCLEGFSLSETASILGISLSGAKMRLSRAREMLKELHGMP